MISPAGFFTSTCGVSTVAQESGAQEELDFGSSPNHLCERDVSPTN
jgi:hypothetical protein